MRNNLKIKVYSLNASQIFRSTIFINGGWAA